MGERTRRQLLAAMGAVAMAGCGGSDGSPTQQSSTQATHSTTTVRTSSDVPPTTTETEPDPQTTTDSPTPEAVPLRDQRRHLGHSTTDFITNTISGGQPKDGIPSIDEPKFIDVETAASTLRDTHRVFGIEINGDARAYPKRVLVFHEIVNDVVGGVPISITYCPLTGTALAFERGETTFGTTGRLVNSNLVMYDRATNTWWPQIAGTGIDGPLEGRSLRERPLAWTRFQLWADEHPDSQILSDDTGYIRPYGRDPYGRDYYDSGPPAYAPMVSDDRFQAKDVVIGVRGTERAVAFEKGHLKTEHVLTSQLDGEPIVAVFDDRYLTAWVYRNPDEMRVTGDGDMASLEGETYRPDALPLEQVRAFEAMWFAWYAFYPDTAVHA